ARPHLAQELLDALGVLQRAVDLEVQLGGPPDVQALAQLAPDERSRGIEALERLRLAGLVTHDPDVDARVIEVRRDIDRRDRDEADAWVLDLALEDLRDLAPELLSQPCDSTPCHRLRWLFGGPAGGRRCWPELAAAAAARRPPRSRSGERAVAVDVACPRLRADEPVRAVQHGLRAPPFRGGDAGRQLGTLP